MPSSDNQLIINTGPLLTLGRAGAFDVIARLPFRFLAPTEVTDEIATGIRLGHPVSIPAWLVVTPLAGSLSPLATGSLDSGEAAVLQLAIEKGIRTVCIDEWRGRRAASAAGLRVTGSLGLLGRAKREGIIGEVRPWVDKLASAGGFFHPELVARFLSAMGETRR